MSTAEKKIPMTPQEREEAFAEIHAIHEAYRREQGGAGGISPFRLNRMWFWMGMAMILAGLRLAFIAGSLQRPADPGPWFAEVLAIMAILAVSLGGVTVAEIRARRAGK